MARDSRNVRKMRRLKRDNTLLFRQIQIQQSYINQLLSNGFGPPTRTTATDNTLAPTEPTDSAEGGGDV
jgi:hypothetical protein